MISKHAQTVALIRSKYNKKQWQIYFFLYMYPMLYALSLFTTQTCIVCLSHKHGSFCLSTTPIRSLYVMQSLVRLATTDKLLDPVIGVLAKYIFFSKHDDTLPSLGIETRVDNLAVAYMRPFLSAQLQSP